MKTNLRDLMYKNNVNITILSEQTGLSRTTITSLYKGQAKGIQFDTLITLCNFFNCTPNDLLWNTNEEIKKEDTETKHTNKEQQGKEKINIATITIQERDDLLLQTTMDFLKNLSRKKTIVVSIGEK